MKYLRIISLFTLLLITPVYAQEININSATAEQIAENIKGVGIKKAISIVEYREKHGNFHTAKDLMKIKGIGQKIVDENEKNLRFK